MDQDIVEYPVRVSTTAGKESSGHVKVQNWNKQERMLRGAKFWGGSWGLAVISVFLPVAHFFLVPAFFIAGPIVGVLTFKQGSVVLGGEGTCPQCGKPLPLVRGPNKWPLEDLCTQCQTHVTVEKR